MLQCVAVRCSALQCVAVCCSALQCVTMRCSVLQCVAVRCSALQCVAVRCSALQCVLCRFCILFVLPRCIYDVPLPHVCVARCFSVLQGVLLCRPLMQYGTVRYSESGKSVCMCERGNLYVCVREEICMYV